VSERFQRLLPDCADGLTAAEIASEVPKPPRGDRPFLAANFVATADGRATIAGRTGPIANRADYELFHALRTRFDAVMVGAQTVRVESYGPIASRAILVSRTVDVPPDVGLLRAPDNRVIVLTPSHDGELDPCAAEVTYLREGDLATAMRRLRAEHGVDSVLCEGGPQVLANLIAAEVVDELHLVYAAKLAGGTAPLTILTGMPFDPPLDLELISLHESGGYLFTRYGL
jgi:5-amino-6-(5-phosphoribosylamino)uracil reductase